MIIYFDMDGVLTDMNLYLSLESGSPEEEICEDKKLREKILYSLYSRDLFQNLPPSRLLEMRALMKRLRDAGHRIEILTSYGVKDQSEMGVGAHEGKQLWLQKHYGDLFLDGTISRFNGVTNCEQKAFFADAESFLIDDHPKNIEEFCSAGGRGFLYDLKTSTLEEVENSINVCR